MTTVQELIDRLEKVSIESLTYEALEATKKNFVESQVDQMQEGKRNDGSDITPPYATSTVARKKRKGQPYDRVTLRDTGEYQGRISATVDNDELRIGSDVEYEKYLDKRYSPRIYGLEDSRLEAYTFGPFWGVLKQKLEEATKLKFV